MPKEALSISLNAWSKAFSSGVNCDSWTENSMGSVIHSALDSQSQSKLIDKRPGDLGGPQVARSYGAILQQLRTTPLSDLDNSTGLEISPCMIRTIVILTGSIYFIPTSRVKSARAFQCLSHTTSTKRHSTQYHGMNPDCREPTDRTEWCYFNLIGVMLWSTVHQPQICMLCDHIHPETMGELHLSYIILRSLSNFLGSHQAFSNHGNFHARSRF